MRPPTEIATVPQAACRAPVVGTAGAVRPGTDTAPMPTAWTWRRVAGVPGANADASTVIRNERALTGRGSVTCPPGPTASGPA